ncbi:BTB/POZ and TAZ domain-containing protein 5-like isoform X3 [Carya illinoinensis]|uniref:BTB/POZ and TAZ domain-containing protein 5-like isoform X3 n=1 Tax=Carya illinoinensis TaxID=32201 RepID=UPI001C728AC5|nr:BTB/POZ and TAZ domain-containing protein 5-like isoform X3 [Carya illinoinensis]
MKYQWMLPYAKTTTSKLFALLRVPGCCVRCKRMWQLLELNSRLCTSYDVFRVPFVQLKTLSLGACSGLGELRKKVEVWDI